MNKQVVPPDDQRCRVNDGKIWRCKRLIAKVGQNVTLCEEHYWSRKNNYRMQQEKKRISREEAAAADGGGGGGLEEKSELDDKDKRKRKRKRRASVSISPKQRHTGTISQSFHDSSDLSREVKADFQSERKNAGNRKPRLKVERKSCCKGEMESGKTKIHEVESENFLEVYKTKCYELCLELEKKKIEFRDLESRKIDVEDELEEYKKLCVGLKKSITCLKEDKIVVRERENKSQERITNMEEELLKMERVKCVNLKTDNNDLECTRRKQVDENEVWKKRFYQLETRVLKMEKENSILRCMKSNVYRTTELEAGGLRNTEFHDDEWEKVLKKPRKHQSETNGGISSGHMAHLQIKEKALGTNEQIFTSAFTGSNLPSSGSSSVDMQGEPSTNVDEKEKTTPLVSKVKFRKKVPKQPMLELGGSSNERQSVFELGRVRPAYTGCTVKISDNDNNLERSWDDEKDVTSKKHPNRLCLDQRDKEYDPSCVEDFPFTSMPKQKLVPKIENSEIEGEGALKMKKAQELKYEVPKPSPVNLCPMMVSNPTVENGKENVVEEVGLDRSSSGFILEKSDSSDNGDSFNNSEDEEDIQLAFDEALAMIFRRRDKEPKWNWKFEADMLSSFEEDPELCMKAVCALYRQQTSEEKSKKDFMHYSNRGFNKFDALRGTTLAEFLMDGDCKADLKKSIKELEIFDPKALDDCKRLARHYSDQLFIMYKNEDPFFLPASTGC